MARADMRVVGLMLHVSEDGYMNSLVVSSISEGVQHGSSVSDASSSFRSEHVRGLRSGLNQHRQCILFPGPKSRRNTSTEHGAHALHDMIARVWCLKA